MVRMKRKKILEVLETARQGYSSLILKALDWRDKIWEQAAIAHHNHLNRMIVEMGGESVEPFICPDELRDEAPHYIKIGKKILKELTEDNMKDIIMMIGCCPSPEFWERPIITDFNNTMFSDTIVIDFHSFRKSDGVKSVSYTFFFNHVDFRYHYHNEREDLNKINRSGRNIKLNIFKYLIDQGFDIPLY